MTIFEKMCLLMTVFPIPLGSTKTEKSPHLGQHWSERNEGVHLLAPTGNTETFT